MLTLASSALRLLTQLIPDVRNEGTERPHRQDVDDQYNQQQSEHRPYQDEVVLVRHEYRRQKIYQRHDMFSDPVKHRFPS
jgi:hypothetical protein